MEPIWKSDVIVSSACAEYLLSSHGKIQKHFYDSLHWVSYVNK